MGKSGALRLSDTRAVFRLIGDVRALQDGVAARKHLADGLCELVHGIHAFTLDLDGLTRQKEVTCKAMTIGGHPDEKGLAYLFESQQANHFRHGDPMTEWACACAARIAARRRSDVLAERVWQTHPYFAEHVRPAGIGDLLIGFYREAENGEAFGISVARTSQDVRFSSRDRQVAELLVHELHELHRRNLFDVSQPALLRDLSARQREVLRALLAGASIKQVARKVGLSRYTVEDHAKAIYRKLGVNSRAELFARCLALAGASSLMPQELVEFFCG